MRIILCGFMSCGKNSIGTRLAKLLGYNFIDMDKYIEEREQMTITDIFAKFGEPRFREIETEVSAELVNDDNVVIATGGGAVMNPKNVEALKSTGGKIYFLDVPVAALKERLKTDTNRPLLQRPDRNEYIEKLHAERLPKYKAAADVVIDAGAPALWLARKMAEKIASEENLKIYDV